MASAIVLGRLMFGSARNPGANLSRPAIGFDLRAISVVEGVRAAFASASILILNEWLNWPPLVFMALAANLTCFCDVGGPISQRLRPLLSFTLFGALAWAGFGLLRPAGLQTVVPIACVAIFVASFVRVWGVPATAVGNVLIVVVILALDQPLTPDKAAVIAMSFIAGGLWAILLALILWRLHPYQPGRKAVADVWRLLAGLAADLRRLALSPAATAAEFDAHARRHRRGVREAVELARGVAMGLVRGRGALSERGAQMLLRLEAGDQIFGSLIAISDLLEDASRTGRRVVGARLLRLLRAVLVSMSRAILSERPLDARAIERAITKLTAQAASDPALARLVDAIAERLRIAARLSTPEGYRAGARVAGKSGTGFTEGLRAAVSANLTWRSSTMRHAARVTAVAAPALALTLGLGGTFAHWLTITLVLTMQPSYAATWQRALERIGGTVLGGIVGAVLVHFAHTPLELAALMFPLAILGFSARQVSFGAFIACLTPLVIVLVELVDPGYGSFEIMAMRALFTVLGGVLAVVVCFILWPSWEPERLSQELRTALAAHGDYAARVMAEVLDEGTLHETELARAAAGVATNNFEASLSRALQEPSGVDPARLEAATVADATLRRVAGRLSALRFEGARAAEERSVREWRDWVHQAFEALARGESAIPPRPRETPSDTFGRIGRQVELLAATLGRVG